MALSIKDADTRLDELTALLEQHNQRKTRAADLRARFLTLGLAVPAVLDTVDAAIAAFGVQLGALNK